MIKMKDLAGDFGYGSPQATGGTPWIKKSSGTQSSGSMVPRTQGQFGQDLGTTENPLDWLTGGGAGGGGYDWMTGGTPESMDFAFPTEWDQYGAWLSKMMGGGGNIGRPGIWDWTEGKIRGMGESGMPVDVSGIYEAMKPISNRYLAEQGADLAEQFGVGGMRYSTPLQYNLVRETERMGENMALQQVQAQIAAEEAARGRMMGAYGMGLNLGQGDVSLGQANLGNQWNAAGGLFGLGQAKSQLPLQVAQMMSGLGSTAFGEQQQGAMGGQINPWLQQALAYNASLGGQPQTYQPSGFTSFLGALGQASPWIMDLLSKGQGSPLGGNAAYTPNFNYKGSWLPWGTGTQESGYFS